MPRRHLARSRAARDPVHPGSRLVRRAPTGNQASWHDSPDPRSTPVETDIYALERRETLANRPVDDRQECLDLPDGIHYLYHDRQVRRQPQNLGRVKAAVGTETLQPAQHGCACKSVLTRLAHDPLIERHALMPVGLTDEDSQQMTFAWQHRGGYAPIH